MTRWLAVRPMLSWTIIFLIVPIAIGQQITSIATRPATHNKTVLRVGYLTAIKGDMNDKQGLAISGAISMALDEVRKICLLFKLH